MQSFWRSEGVIMILSSSLTEIQAFTHNWDRNFKVHLFYIRRTRQGLYQLLMVVDDGGIWTCVHLHVSCLLYHCATDADILC